jgi:hypothetical protein
MAKRITIYKGTNTQIIWEEDLPNMERKGWSAEAATAAPKKPKSVKVIDIVEEIENGDI